MNGAGGGYEASGELPQASNPAPREALAVWVSVPGDPFPIQGRRRLAREIRELTCKPEEDALSGHRRSVSAYAACFLFLQEICYAHDQQPEEPMMINSKQEEPVGRRPAEIDEDWFIRIQRAKTAREQGQKAREGRPPVNPLSRVPLSLNHD